jgi:hypothetical protein
MLFMIGTRFRWKHSMRGYDTVPGRGFAVNMAGRIFFLPAIFCFFDACESRTKIKSSLFGTTHVWWWSGAASAPAQIDDFSL